VYGKPTEATVTITGVPTSMAQFEAKVSAQPDRVVVALAGECDLAVRDELSAALLTALGTARTVVVDLAELRFLDSSGIHGLVAAHHAAVRDSGRLYVVNARGPVADLLDLTGVGDLLRPPDGLLSRPLDREGGAGA
jgi:anti-sigma B factor antagonist